MYLDTTSSGNSPFSANIFIGNLYVSGIQLNTSPTNIYDINIVSDIILDTGGDDYTESAYFTNISYYTIINPSNHTNNILNCVAYSDTIEPPISSISGQ